MRENPISYFLAGRFGRSKALSLKSGIPSHVRLGHENEAAAKSQTDGPDAYKAAVLLLAGVCILSLLS